MFLKKFETDEELRKALEETKDNVHLLTSHHSIKIGYRKWLPKSPTHAFLHENSSGAKLWIVVIVNDYLQPNLVFDCHPNDYFQKEELWKVFDKIAKLFPFLYTTEGRPLFISHQAFFILYEEWLLNRFPYVNLVDKDKPPYSLYLYYMSTDQQKNLQNLKNELSPEYFFDQVNLEIEPKIIAENWNYSQEYDVVKHMEALLRNLPYSLIREQGSNKIVAFELVFQTGMQFHQFCFPEYRRQGFGKAIELDQAQKCIKFGLVPYKVVGFHNKHVMASADRSPFWTRWEIDGKPVVLRYIFHSVGKDNI